MRLEPDTSIAGYRQSEVRDFLGELESCGAEEAARRRLHGSGRLFQVISVLQSEGLIFPDREHKKELYWKVNWKLTDRGRRFATESVKNSQGA